MRPTKYLGMSRGGRWTSVDRALTEGLLHYEASLNSLGIPAWIAQEPERRFNVDEIVDGSIAVLEENRAEMAKAENLTPGLNLVITDGGPAPA